MKEVLEVFEGDIVLLDVDAIVNAANSSLLGGGGVDGAIHKAAGPLLLTECRSLGGCNIGHAVITSGYNLKARKIIHTVGPIWQGGEAGEHDLLASCYRQCVRIATEYNLATIAFPSISTGAYGFPVDEAVHIAVNTVRECLSLSSSIKRVTFVAFRSCIADAYHKEIYC